MNIAIIYDSKTGNTKRLAEAIQGGLEKENELLFMSAKEALEKGKLNQDIDLYFLGSWTNKGTIGDDMKAFCDSLIGAKVALFGTAGFGGSKEYYDALVHRFKEVLSENIQVLGDFYCQGKMPEGIRNRYVSMLTEHPEDEKLKVSIENFDDAKSHPNENDIQNIKSFAKKIIKTYKEDSF